MRVDAQLVDQPLVVEARSTAPQDGDAAQRIDPGLAGMGSQLIAVVTIDGGKGEDRLLCCTDGVQRLAHAGKRHLTAAQKPVEVQHHRLDLAI